MESDYDLASVIELFRSLTEQDQQDMLTYSGRTMSVSRWAVEIGISRGTLVSRLSAGWSVQQAIETPVEHKYASKIKKSD